MSAEKSRGGRPVMTIHDEAGQFPDLAAYKTLTGDFKPKPFKWGIAGIDPYEDATDDKKYERRRLAGS